jgi:hypothetical protein
MKEFLQKFLRGLLATWLILIVYVHTHWSVALCLFLIFIGMEVICYTLKLIINKIK